ncbi:MAG: hypothetical protein L3K19_01740 [Thermoplasmata archaeon]|nr:hypothetical protein [Thermoplasmata archaeon]
MAYDAKDGYVVLFGGGGATKMLSDTWTYKAGTWTKLAPTTHPSARFTQAMVYDAADGYVLLFGGNTNNGATLFGDTWTFSAGVWTKLHTSVAPSPRYGMSMAFDAKDHYVVLFGGQGPTTLYNDTWTFSHGHWTQLTPTTVPPPRRSGGMAYDAADGYVLMFGGLSYSDANDTWEFVGGAWTQISQINTTAPGVRVAPAMVYDAKDRHVVLFGGRDDNSFTLYADTWTFHSGVWTLRHPSTSPAARQWPSAAFDGADGYVVMFGGGSSNSVPVTVLSDTHTYLAGTWT